MKVRDLAIVAAVVLLGALAALDALRGDASPPARGTTAIGTTNRADEDPLSRETFPVVPARGALAFAAGDDCRLRDVSVSAGIEFPLPPIETACQLWAAPITNRLAYALVSMDLVETAPVRFLDPGRPGLDLGTFETWGGVVWSHDGQRAAWCESATSGREYRVGEFDTETGERALRDLDFCPRAYTPEGKLTYAGGQRLSVEGGGGTDVGGHIDHVAWGTDGSVGLVLDALRLVRREGGRVTHRGRLPEHFFGTELDFSPDNCAVLAARGGVVRLLDLGCFAGASQVFDGLTAAWSPDGEWIAVGEFAEIVFYRVVGRSAPVGWNASANGLAWR